MQTLARAEINKMFDQGLLHSYHPSRPIPEISDGRLVSRTASTPSPFLLRCEKGQIIGVVLHSEEGKPAFTRTTSYGTITEWYENGLLHRSEGYAVERRSPEGELISGEVWYYGVRDWVLVKGKKYRASSEKPVWMGST